MPAPIQSKQIIVSDPFKDTRVSAEKTETVLVSMSGELQKTLEMQQKLAKSAKKGAAGYKELADAERKSAKALSEKEKIDKRIVSLQQKVSKVTKVQRERLAALRVEEQRRNKIAKEQAQLTNKNISAFDKLNIRIKNLSNQYRNLLVAEGKETKQTRRLRAEILKLNKVRNTANENLGRHQHKVGQYGNAIGRLRGGLAQLGLAFGVFTLIRNSISIISDWDQATTDLAAISGKTAEELKPLNDQALELGATTQFTASQIAGLQIELAKLGFTVEEISASTGPIANFATATGADLSDAAALAGSTLRAFGLDATEMERVVSTLAVATTKTALDFNFLNSAMATIAPVAKAFGFSVEDTTALLGQLANSGFDASSAATATRNILLNLADANGDLAQALGHPVTSADDLAGALIELKDKGVDLATALELTDKRSVAAFNTFLEGSDDLVELRDSITGVSGELDEMSAKKLDSISGATDLLKSAWEGLILEWNEGSGVGGSLKNVLLFLAQNLKQLVKIVLNAIALWATYKTAMKAATTANNLFGGSLAKMKQTFGAVGLAITGAILVLKELWDWYNQIDTASERFGVSIDKVNEKLDAEKFKLKELGKELLRAKDNTEERQKVLDKINAEYGTTLENMENEAEFAKQIADAYVDIVQNLQKKISLQVFEEELVGANKELLKLDRQLSKGPGGLAEEALKKAKFELESYISLLEGKLVKLQTDLGTAPVGGAPCAEGFEKNEAGECVPIGGGPGGPAEDAEKRKLDRLKKLQKEHNEFLLHLENELIAVGEDRDNIDRILFEKRKEFMREEGSFIKELDFKDTEILKKHRNDYLKFVEDGEIERINVHEEANDEISTDDLLSFQLRENNKKKHDERMLELERQLWNDIRKQISETEKMFEHFINNNIKKLDQQIAKEQIAFQDAKDREQQLRDIAKERNLDATESIKAEREEQKRALKAQQDLERKKQQAEALIAALRALAAKIEAGDGNPVVNIKADINNLKSFIEGSFYEGTDYTLADALGSTGTRDGHIIRADDGEAIFNPKQTSDLDIGPGGNSTQDIVNMYKNGVLASSVRQGLVSDKAMRPVERNINNGLLNEVTKLVKKANQPKEKLTFDTLTGVLEHQYRSANTKKTVKYQVRK